MNHELEVVMMFLYSEHSNTGACAILHCTWDRPCLLVLRAENAAVLEQHFPLSASLEIPKNSEMLLIWSRCLFKRIIDVMDRYLSRSSGFDMVKLICELLATFCNFVIMYLLECI